ncbi:hypothetical protein [uncultured Maribacter sp.]|uniref:hypothetical protein n=1 Tax=uncultured Maribacter sp. TaxID=431308 RepID=UPI0030D8CE1B|tara:strand:- start:26 stop:442 length:417 start_codon:yes stop_codon:yes gene_type:complete
MKQLLLFCTLLISSCGSKVDQEQLYLLNGYWEIKEVTFKDGTKKEYSVNTTVDFISLDSLKGYKKKMSPKFNGTFETSNDTEPIQIRISNDTIFIKYTTEFNTWEEVLLSLSEKSFSVKNDQDITYFYERYEPININP